MIYLQATAIFGAGNDLQIYHSGTSSRIQDIGTGNLIIDTDGTEIQLTSGSIAEYMLRAVKDGAVTLYYDGSPKLATTATGIDVTGTVTADGLTGESTLPAISTDITDTAVDVFVYDTRKDSDGGAWRKRTQHTSWYNETLNTSTRGSRKEFPAVAVIVAESDQVTIYDGDDPDLPMWMVFNPISNSILRGSITDVSSVVMGQAQLIVGANDNSGMYRIDFIKDNGTRFGAVHTTNTGTFHLTIAERSGIAPISVAQSSGLIVNGTVNDVAMTVLPNAPIDDATGLPVPTIAVATAGGVSVIKDDGSVVDSSATASVSSVSFNGDNSTLISNDVSGNRIRVYDDWSSSFVQSAYYTSNESSIGTGIALSPTPSGQFDLEGHLNTTENDYAIRTSTGFSRLSENKVSRSTGMVAYTTSSYNTGWMNGDIKLATLSDTDDTDVTGSELVTNGTFDSDTTGWTVGTGWSISSGKLYHTGTGSRYDQYNIPLEIGKTYVITATMTLISGSSNTSFQVYHPSGGTLVDGAWVNAPTGAYSATIPSGTTYVHTTTLTATSNSIQIGGYSTDTFEIDNISVRLAEEDRSVNGNGLQVFGTVTKNPVATGADLVGYGGWSTSNYLMQPRNAATEIGTGDAAWIVWAKTTSSGAGEMLVSREGDGYDTAFNIRFQLGKPHFWATNDSFATAAGGTSTGLYDDVARNDGTWHCYAWVKQGTTYTGYADGKQIVSGTYDLDMSDTSDDEVIAIGIRRYTGATQPFGGSIALTRFSHTAPSASQIAKIYEDEKVLFQENAKATLYGSSDAVTALAYDDDTNLLHVGTSAGRSDFQGLRRVDNTTTAVGAAISASNGLIAED